MSAASREEHFADFLDNYYAEEIQRIASGVAETKTLFVDAGDLQRFLPQEDYQTVLEAAKEYNGVLSRAVGYTDASQGVVAEANVSIIDDSGAGIQHLGVSEVSSDNVKEYIGVSGQLTAVTKIRSFPEEALWVCAGCGLDLTTTPDTRELNEPTESCRCEAAPRWQLDYQESTWIDHRKLKVQQPPEKAANGETQHLVAHVFGADTSDAKGTPLIERAGEEVTVYGVVELRQQDGRGAASYLFNHYLRAEAVVFEEGGIDSVDIEAHKQEIETHARAENVYERFYTSLAPQIHPTPQLELAMKVCAAYLFSAPRVDPDDGPMYRGDIHAAIFGDPGMAKSVLLAGVSEFSPEAEHRSATGLASDVGLVAAAVDDDFGEGGWTLKPGILVRAGMHAIIDEIDKGPDELEKINDALEGRQIATVDKGGIKADLKTRTGLLTSGNPENSRFDKEEPLAAQVDVDESLLTRFDAIVLLMDEADEEQDRKIADHITESFAEGVELVRDDGQPETNTTERIVEPEVGRAWVALGRQIVPRLTENARNELREFYVDARTANAEAEDGETFSATARQLEGGIRFAMAFARMRLSETVEQQDVDMAIEVSKALIGQTHDPEKGSFDIDYLTTGSDGNSNQYDRMQSLEQVLSTTEIQTTEEIAAQTDMDKPTVRKQLNKLSKKGEVYEPDGQGNGWMQA